MSKRFKKIVALSIIIIGGYICISGNRGLNINNIISSGMNISSNERNTSIKEENKPLLVNNKVGLDKKYKPKDLEIPNIQFVSDLDDDERKMDKVAIKPLEELVNTAKEHGIILIGNSAYRSYEMQRKLYKESIKSNGIEHTKNYVAKPGFSEHQSGLSIDITNEKRYFAKGTIEANWLAQNCYKYGFIIRYPEDKKDITGIAYEPWHIRYVGKEVAKDIHDNNITLEEYLKK